MGVFIGCQAFVLKSVEVRYVEHIICWYLLQIFPELPHLLQFAHVLLLAGIVEFFWNINHIVAVPAAVAVFTPPWTLGIWQALYECMPQEAEGLLNFRHSKEFPKAPNRGRTNTWRRTGGLFLIFKSGD